MKKFLFKKIIDQSLFKAGFTIPSEYNERIQQELGVSLSKGDQCFITIYMNGNKYETSLKYINNKDSNRKVLQIRYNQSSDICVALKDIFSQGYSEISEKVKNKQGKQKISIDDQYINIYVVGDKSLEFECFPTFSAKNNSVLNEFYDYLGSDSDLSGYQRSYKLVFFKIFFEHQKNGGLAVSELVKYFKEYYIAREREGKQPDVHVDKVISKPSESSDNAILQLILRNPFKAISKKGFFSQTTIDDIDSFVLSNELKNEMTDKEEKNILALVDKKLELYYSKIDGFEKEKNKQIEQEKSEGKVTTKDIIERISDYIAASGFNYPEGVIENFFLSLKSKPFIILAGISGTGKTKLVKLFAEAIGATPEESGGNGRYKLVSVRPDWSDSSDLFGHVNLQGDFISGAIIDFVKRASKDLKNPYFLCLDEMNLARVEYYLSDFLSLIETRRKIDDEIVTDEILLDKAAEENYGKVILPENLYVIGTVNMDETTFPFSKKVLDRANTIEFSYVDLIPSFSYESYSEASEDIDNDFLKTEYLTLALDIPEEDQIYVVEICEELQDINNILQIAQAHIGYRVRDEIVFYLINNKNAELLSRDDALDNEIMQKILPRIQGSNSSVKEMLCELFKKFAGDYSGLNMSTISEQMETFINSRTCKYKKSAEKICYMMRRFEEDGFTSYWL